jgi:YHS domain-containing protein
MILFIGVFSSVLLAQYEPEKEEYEEQDPIVEEYNASEEDSKEKPAKLKNRFCPVTLEKITTGGTYTYAYEEKAYRFSSLQAIEEFEKDPQKYLKEWEKKEKFYKINIIYD